MTVPDTFFDAERFVESVGGSGALLGLDPGTKTIGAAISDIDWSLASPVKTIRRTKFVNDVKDLLDIIDRENIVGLVIGMPFNMDGTTGPRAQSVRAFRRELGQHIDLPMLFWDERLSSAAANEAMAEAGVRNRRRRETIDAVAAAHILADCLPTLRSLTNR